MPLKNSIDKPLDVDFAYLSRPEIDTAKWDACIEKSSFPLIYALSWYLDTVTEKQWDALIWGDYEKVFPIPWNQKPIFFKQVYQPFFCQQLGLFSQQQPASADLNFCLNFLNQKFKRIHLHLHEASNPPPVFSGFDIIPRTNCVLNLDKSYPELSKKYSRSLKRNLLKAERFDLQLLPPIPAASLAALYQKMLGDKIEVLKMYHLDLIKKLMETAIQKNVGRIVVAGNDDGIHVAGFFLFFENRIINLFGASTEKGKESGAMHFLLDCLIRQNAEEQKVFDFEGSSIPSIAAFFKSFGAEERNYFLLRKK